MRSEEARQQAQAEGLTLRKTNSTSGFVGVHLQTQPGQPKPYQARVRRGDNKVHLGSFATAEEAALCIARSPGGQAAAQRAAAAELSFDQSATAWEIHKIAELEGRSLKLLVDEHGDSHEGEYRNVSVRSFGPSSRNYRMAVARGPDNIELLYWTAEEAALVALRLHALPVDQHSGGFGLFPEELLTVDPSTLFDLGDLETAMVVVPAVVVRTYLPCLEADGSWSFWSFVKMGEWLKLKGDLPQGEFT